MEPRRFGLLAIVLLPACTSAICPVTAPTQIEVLPPPIVDATGACAVVPALHQQESALVAWEVVDGKRVLAYRMCFCRGQAMTALADTEIDPDTCACVAEGC